MTAKAENKGKEKTVKKTQRQLQSDRKIGKERSKNDILIVHRRERDSEPHFNLGEKEKREGGKESEKRDKNHFSLR